MVPSSSPPLNSAVIRRSLPAFARAHQVRYPSAMPSAGGCRVSHRFLCGIQGRAELSPNRWPFARESAPRERGERVHTVRRTQCSRVRPQVLRPFAYELCLRYSIVTPFAIAVAFKKSSNSENSRLLNVFVRDPSMTIPPSSPGAMRAVSLLNAAVNRSFHSSAVRSHIAPLTGHCSCAANASNTGHIAAFWARLRDGSLIVTTYPSCADATASSARALAV